MTHPRRRAQHPFILSKIALTQAPKPVILSKLSYSQAPKPVTLSKLSFSQAPKPVILSEAIASFAIAQSKNPEPAHPAKALRTFLTRIPLCISIALALLFAATLPAHAQGCTQCLDTTRSTPSSVQAAYRHAILLLGGFAATLFIAGGILLTRRQP